MCRRPRPPTGSFLTEAPPSSTRRAPHPSLLGEQCRGRTPLAADQIAAANVFVRTFGPGHRRLRFARPHFLEGVPGRCRCFRRAFRWIQPDQRNLPAYGFRRMRKVVARTWAGSSRYVGLCRGEPAIQHPGGEHPGSSGMYAREGTAPWPHQTWPFSRRCGLTRPANLSRQRKRRHASWGSPCFQRALKELGGLPTPSTRSGWGRPVISGLQFAGHLLAWLHENPQRFVHEARALSRPGES